MSIYHNLYDGLKDICYIWKQEMKQMLKDEGVVIFFFVVPILYPILYSWIYNNEVIHEVPVVVVDQSHSSLSRQFIRMCDASPDVKIISHAADLDEAKLMMSKQLARGIYVIPSDFDIHLNRMEQSTVSVYCDMSLMLAYKAVYQTAQSVSMQMGSEIQTKLSGHYTAREEQISARPLNFEEVPIFNPTGGYGSFILPGVLILIIQQTLVLGIGLAAGTARENNYLQSLIPLTKHYNGMYRIVAGKALAYFMVYCVMTTWLVLGIPKLFHFTAISTWQTLAIFLLPYLLACIFFGMVVSLLVRYRENVMLLVVFVSVPLLFLSGVSWPQSDIPGIWQGISWLFPSTFGVRGFIRLNEMGATIDDVKQEYLILWIHVIIYFLIACLVYRYQIFQARQNALNRLNELKVRAAEHRQKDKNPS